MPDGLLNELDFEKRIAQLSDRELIEFVARQQYTVSMLCPVQDKRLTKLESRTKKELGVVGGAGAFVGSAIGAVLNFFLGR